MAVGVEKDMISQQLALSENNKKTFGQKKITSFNLTSPFGAATTIDTAKVCDIIM